MNNAQRVTYLNEEQREESRKAGKLDESICRRFIDWQMDRSDRTRATYAGDLGSFAAWLAYSKIEEPTRESLLAFRAWLLNDHPAIKRGKGGSGWDYAGRPNTFKKCAPGTIRQYLRTVFAYFAWTESQGLFPNIAAGLDLPRRDPDATSKRAALTPEDFQKVESVAGRIARDRAANKIILGRGTPEEMERAMEIDLRAEAMFLLASISGLRAVELSRARVRDYVIEGGKPWLYIWGKGRKEANKRKALSPETAAALERYLAARNNPPKEAPLFAATGNRSGGKPIEARTISTMLKRLLIAAGYNSERYTAHSLRHTAGTAAMHATGNDLFTVQKYMRHTDPKTTEIYLHMDQESQETELAAEVEKYLHGAS